MGLGLQPTDESAKEAVSASGLEAWEQRFWARGDLVAGVDEAGRGPLAGPVVAAALVVLAKKDKEVLDILSRVNDSKKLSSQQREALYEELTSAKFKGRIAWSVAEASVTEIDSSNILQASLSAMAKAVRGLSASAMESLVVLVDGCNRPPELLAAGEKWTRLSQRDREALKNQTKLSRWFAQKEKQEKEEPWRPKDVEAVVEGDGRVPSISAASVLAKVYRDRRMEALDEVHPGYDFKTHKGYGTEAHLKAIKLHGICPEHRRSFEPVRQALVTEGQGLEPTKREKRDKRESDCDSESKRGKRRKC